MTDDYSSEEGTLKALRNKCIEMGLDLVDQVAYVLATVEWETARTFKPVREAFWKSEEWRQEHLRYWPYYGRGYVQLTWQSNYKHYARKLGLDLVGNPDLALDPEIAAVILIDGFKEGSFTGKKLSTYINEGETDFYNARRCINGVDHADDIASLAEKYQKQILAEG